jgi:hypothetical protein
MSHAQPSLPIASTTSDGQTTVIHDDYPSWYRPSKARKKSNFRVLRGLHPFGHELGPEGSRCGDCVLRTIRRAGNKTFSKCMWEKSPWSGSSTTDVIQRWRGCVQFERAYPTHTDEHFRTLDGRDIYFKHTEFLTADQWLLVFEDDVKRLANLPQEAAPDVAIDKLLSEGRRVEWLERWHELKGLAP